MNILYLLKTLDTTNLEDVVKSIDLAPLDLNLAIGEAEARGEIEVDREKGKIKALVESTDTWHDPELADKILRTMDLYAAQKHNLTAGRLNSLIYIPGGDNFYKLHEYLMTVQHLIDTGVIYEDKRTIPEVNKMPGTTLIFLCREGIGDKSWNDADTEEWKKVHQNPANYKTKKKK